MRSKSLIIINKHLSHLVLIFLSACSFAGCSFRKKALDNISRQFQYLDQYKSEVVLGEKVHKISWNEARKLLLKQNLRLQQTRRQVEQTQDRRKKNWRNYIPGIQGTASLNKRLLEIDDFSLDNISFSAFLRLRVPNPITFSGEVQALNLAEYTAEKRYILQERQMVVQLYQTFLRYENMEIQFERMNKPLDKHLRTSQDIVGAIRNSDTLERTKENHELQVRQLSLALSNLLEVRGKTLLPDYKSLPKLGYRDSSRNYLKEDKFGLLAMQITAANLEASRLRLQQVKLSRYPSINFSASAPQLFSSNSGTTNTFDPEAISLFGGASKGFDWTGREKDRIKFSKQDYLMSVKQAQSQINSDKESLRNVHRRLVETNEQLRRLRESRKSLAGLARVDLSPNSFSQTLERIISLDEQIDRLEFQTRYQELQFWIWDENKW